MADSAILQNYSITEFKELVDADYIKILKNKDTGGAFMASSRGSLGPVSSTFDPSEPAQVIEVKDKKDRKKTIHILCNVGDSDKYETLITF